MTTMDKNMKTLGPLECTFDDKAEDAILCEVLKKLGMSSSTLWMAAITIVVLVFVLLMLGIQTRCEGSMSMPQVQIFLKFSLIYLTL